MLVFAGVAVAKSPIAHKPKAVAIAAADVKHGRGPAAFPAGAQLAVLYGDPSKTGLFVMRLKIPDDYHIAPHWHSRDEQLTVLSGTLLLGMGDTADAQTQALDAGSFHFLPARMHHFAATRGETVVEIHGQGPFDIHYLDSADDPTHRSKVAK